MNRYQNNFAKTLELIDTCFTLKEAYFRHRYPARSRQEIMELLYQDILERKERQWRSQKDFLKR